MRNQKLTIIRVVFFCLSCSIVFAAISSLTKNLVSGWKQHLLLIISIVITYLLTSIFIKWEDLTLVEIGLKPKKATFRKIIIGFGIGILMTAVQAVIVLSFGHFTMVLNNSISLANVIFSLSLYILVAIREEVTFRGYPLFSLHYRYGFYLSQIIVLILFSLEHVAGGMTWLQAFAGAGTGALLFGFAAIRTKGIALPIGLHIAWNFGQWCFGFKNTTGIFQGISDRGFENIVERNGWISYLIIMISVIIGFYLYKPTKDEILNT